jgi:hypothetical protein
VFAAGEPTEDGAQHGVDQLLAQYHVAVVPFDDLRRQCHADKCMLGSAQHAGGQGLARRLRTTWRMVTSSNSAPTADLHRP